MVNFEKICFAQIDYLESWEIQKKRVAQIVAGEAGNLLLMVEHPPVYTLGRSGKQSEILQRDIPVVNSDRGGRVTYHGPGQMVAYVVCDLRPNPRAVRAHVDKLEKTVINTLQGLGIKGVVERENPGVWVDGAKIAALGVRISRGVAYHGISLNRNPDMNHFSGIIPCGLQGRSVTSLWELGVDISRHQLEERFESAFKDIFAVAGFTKN
ncbi:MAG: lipoyl(octanoyl) transferase LipB [Magnetococcales bacterium]|nr:lipoyl(octanoyl) transferase LipB [Magnetococcales bacterium]